jgi:hypothetical protein
MKPEDDGAPAALSRLRLTSASPGNLLRSKDCRSANLLMPVTVISYKGHGRDFKRERM